MNALHEHELPFGTLYFFEHFAIGVMNEGITLSEEENNTLLDLCREHFAGKPYGYISYRINSYSVNPTIYNAFSEEDRRTFIAFAVVSKNPLNELTAKTEKLFFKNFFKQFNTIEEAEAWVSEKVITAKSQSA